jgi:hypothetical protein
MSRYLLALAATFGLCVCSAQAQYVRIKINLNDYPVDTTATGGDPTMRGFPGGFPGGEGPMGGSPGGFPGGIPGEGGTGSFPGQPGNPMDGAWGKTQKSPRGHHRSGWKSGCPSRMPRC